MQAASSSYLPPHPQHFYPNIYHIQHIGPQDHELKRQYLTLLPPQQIIEICLSFDVHVPPYIKSTIWPTDLNAAIANLQKTTSGDASSSTSAQIHNDTPQVASQDKLSASNSSPETSTSNTETQTTEPQPPDKQPDNAPETPTTAQTPLIAATPATPAASTPSAHPSIQQQPPYPHQPYGYHPTPYPHAPYYAPPPGYPAYPPSVYPPYAPVPNGYPHPPPPHPGYPIPPNPYPPAHVPQPPTHQDQGSDDLPSYEEMIVEALQESTDPEGCAPKDLFAWMAARYPLQSNFRPSASQALQKAYKRGRLEKGSNGKYRISATWEGGNTSRRTTRRPQTQSQSQSSSLAPPPSASPFTHAPLVHHPNPAQQNAHPQPYPGHPYPYPYGGPVPPGYPGYPPPQPQPPQAHTQQPSDSSDASKTTLDQTDKPASGSDADRDAYEAAQNILKAINFGDLLQIAQDEGDGKKSGDVSVDQLTSLLLQAQSGLLQGASSQPVAVPPQPIPNVDVAPPGVIPPAISGRVPNSLDARAELQAQLVLLAAQLADLGHENGDATQPFTAQTTSGPQEIQQQPSPNSTIAGTPPPMDSLLPPPEASTSQTPPNPPVSSIIQQEREDSIPIDPVLQNLSVTTQPQNTQITKEPTQPPPVEGEYDSDDEDMEEII